MTKTIKHTAKEQSEPMGLPVEEVGLEKQIPRPTTPKHQQ